MPSHSRAEQQQAAKLLGVSEPSGSARHWEAAYPVIANDHDSPDAQIFGDLVQVCQDDG